VISTAAVVLTCLAISEIICRGFLDYTVAGEFFNIQRRREKREAPGRITSASPTAQSIRTVPHWITSFSTKKCRFDRNVDGVEYKLFVRVYKRHATLSGVLISLNVLEAV
jgi:hypothetical protein